MTPAKQEAGAYVVVAVGAGYRTVDGNYGLGLKGRVITLEADEAERLTALGSVAEASDEDAAREKAFVEALAAPYDPPAPADNPYGGKALESKEEHAEKARAASKKTG